jgi:hypothetical protein
LSVGHLIAGRLWGVDQAVSYFVQAEIVLKIMISCAPPGFCRKDEDMANTHSWGKNVELSVRTTSDIARISGPGSAGPQSQRGMTDLR